MRRRWLPIGAVLVLLAAVALWLPLGRTTPDTPPSPTRVPEIAAPPTTGAAAPTPAPAPVTSDATFPPPHPPEPITLRTPAGELRWEASEPLDLPADGGWFLGFATRRDGTPVLGVGTGDGALLVEPAGATAWTARDTTGLASPAAAGQLFSAGGDLLLTGWERQAIRVWWESSPGSWDPLPFEEPGPGVGWLRPGWETPAFIVEAGSDVELHSTHRSFVIDWPALLGARVPDDEWWSLQPGGRLLVLRDDESEATGYRAEVEAAGETLTVRVTDEETGGMVAEESVLVRGAAELAATLSAGDALPPPPSTPVRWRLVPTRGFEIVGGGFADPGGLPFDGRIVHGDHGYLAVRAPSPPGQERLAGLWHSADGVAWEDIAERLGIDAGQVVAITVRGREVVAVVRTVETYELANGVSARGPVDRLLVSDDLVSWRAEPLGDPGRTQVHLLAAGPLGLVAVGGDGCNPRCDRRVWVSTDAAGWPSASLASEAIPDDIPVLVTGDAVFIPEFVDIRAFEIRIWAGRLG